MTEQERNAAFTAKLPELVAVVLENQPCKAVFSER